MYITQNPESKLLRQDLKHSVKVDTIDMIPRLWRVYVLKIINLHSLTFRQDDNKVEVLIHILKNNLNIYLQMNLSFESTNILFR